MQRETDHGAEGERDLIRIVLRLEGYSPTGRVTAVGGATRAFSGWLGLMSAVDALTGRDDESEAERADQ
jgi:hypothetical protein